MSSDVKVMGSVFGTGVVLGTLLMMQFVGVNKRIDDLRSEVTNSISVVDRNANRAAAAANSRTAGVQTTMSDRVADLQKVVNERMGDLQVVVNDRVNDIGKRIDELHVELRDFNTRLNSVNARFAGVDQSLESLSRGTLWQQPSDAPVLVFDPDGNPYIKTTTEPRPHQIRDR